MVKRGDIVLVNLEPVRGSEQGKTRPAIIIQHNTLNKYSNTTIIVPISSTIYEKEYPMHVLIENCGLKNKGTIKTEHIRAIDKKRITKKIGEAKPEIIKKIGQAIQHVLDYY
jgi:mRNA interferase MazF